jgi:hypothetical protein
MDSLRKIILGQCLGKISNHVECFCVRVQYYGMYFIRELGTAKSLLLLLLWNAQPDAHRSTNIIITNLRSLCGQTVE